MTGELDVSFRCLSFLNVHILAVYSCYFPFVYSYDDCYHSVNLLCLSFLREQET